MDYQPPELCVVTIEQSDIPGMVYLDLRSVYDTVDQEPKLVDHDTVDFVMKDPYQVPICIPGWDVETVE